MKGANFMNSVQVSSPNRNMFNLSHEVKLSFDMGYLIPTMAIDTLPGDKFNVAHEVMLRFQALAAPTMHRFDVYNHTYFIPNRILWPNWEKFITDNNGQGNLPAPPTITIFRSGDPGEKVTNYTPLCDYFGLPLPKDPDQNFSYTVSVLPFAAYQKTYWDYYRDQNLIDPDIDFPDLLDGDNSANADFWLQLRVRAWEKDYFTAALPFAQKGQPVELPLGSTDVVLKDNWNVAGQPVFVEPSGDPAPAGAVFTDAAGHPTVSPDPQNLAYDPKDTLEVVNESITINELRSAMRLQEYYEKMARGGSRYTEVVKVFFGVNSQDSRLQRPEYIVGSKSPVVVSEVLAQSKAEDASLGDMGGHGIAVVNGRFSGHFCFEHGWIITLTSVMPKTAYQQGIHRKFTRNTSPQDYYWPQFAHIGEQEIKNKEIFAWDPLPEGTFGYMPRYAEYRTEPNRVAGLMRTLYDYWHAGRIFDEEGTPPRLNQSFVECNATNRIFAVQVDQPNNLLAYIYHRVSALRPIPVFGTPTF